MAPALEYITVVSMKFPMCLRQSLMQQFPVRHLKQAILHCTASQCVTYIEVI